MKISKPILLLLLGVMVIPIFSIIVLSFQNTGGELLKWYYVILKNERFTEAFGLSLVISTITALLCTFFSFIFSLTWFNKNQMFVVLVLILVIGLLPPDIMALSIIKVSQLLGLYNSNLLFLCIGLTLYTMPIGVLLFWSRFYFIPDSLIISGKDIGMKRFYIVTKIILPLSRNTAISCFLLSFLLAFNEYPRTYYLSGADVLVSEFLNGKLSSGADGSIYAGGSITIIITAVSILLMALFQAIFNHKGQTVNAKS